MDYHRGPVDSACIRCGSNTGLARRAIVTWRGREGDPEVRVLRVATCEGCRTHLRKLRDAHDYAASPNPERWRRFRAWDVTGTVLVLAAGYAIGAAAGWVGAWSLWIAAALAVAAFPTNLLARRLLDAREETLIERFRATPAGREHEAEERRLRELWRQLAARIERETGFSTEHRCAEGALRSIDDRALVDPDLWSPRRDGGVPYVLCRHDGTVERRELEAAEASRPP